MWFKNYIFAKKCNMISFCIAFMIPSHFIIVPYFSLWMLEFFTTIQVSNSLDPDQARHFVRPDLGPNCLQRLSADNKSPLAGKELNTKQRVTKTLAKVIICFGSNFFHLAKVLATKKNLSQGKPCTPQYQVTSPY